MTKLLYNISIMLGIVTAVFFLFNILPADPTRMTMGQRSDMQTIESARKELGLDKPLFEQYIWFINDLSPISIHDDNSENNIKYNYKKIVSIGEKCVVFKIPYLRRSYQTQKEVTLLLIETIPNTLILAFGAIIFATIVGITMGIFAAIFKDSFFEKIILSISIIGISTPSFFAGIIISWLFGFLLSDYTGLNMSGSLNDYNPFEGEVVVWKNLWLPLITLGIRPLAIIVQLTRSSLLDILEMDYIRTARAKGLSFRNIIVNHALRNALNPVLTAVSGWLASLIAGSFFIEYIFGYNGLGKITVDALEVSDFPVVMGAILFCGLIFLIINSIVDVLYQFLDPRISK